MSALQMDGAEVNRQQASGILKRNLTRQSWTSLQALEAALMRDYPFDTQEIIFHLTDLVADGEILKKAADMSYKLP